MLKNNFFKTKRAGMIALLPAIVISSILLIIVVSESQAFLSSLEREALASDKTQSLMVAKSCLRRVLVKIIKTPSYLGGEMIVVNDISCVVSPIIQQNIEVSVKIGRAESVDKVIYDIADNSITQEEVF